MKLPNGVNDGVLNREPRHGILGNDFRTRFWGMLGSLVMEREILSRDSSESSSLLSVMIKPLGVVSTCMLSSDPDGHFTPSSRSRWTTLFLKPCLRKTS
jgi:hypothetical protein